MRGAAPGSVHGGMLETLADVTCALLCRCRPTTSSPRCRSRPTCTSATTDSRGQDRSRQRGGLSTAAVAYAVSKCRPTVDADDRNVDPSYRDLNRGVPRAVPIYSPAKVPDGAAPPPATANTVIPRRFWGATNGTFTAALRSSAERRFLRSDGAGLRDHSRPA